MAVNRSVVADPDKVANVWHLATAEPERLETSAAGEAVNDFLDPPDTSQIHGIACHADWRFAARAVLFAGVMKELLAPINNPRYVIIGKEWGVRLLRELPCPSVFARRQQDAEILRRQLDRCLTHCTMVYARTEEGRHTLLRCQTRSFLNRDEQLPHILTTTSE